MNQSQATRMLLLSSLAVIVIAALLFVGPGKLQQAWAANSPLLSPLVVSEVAGCWTIREDKSIAVSTSQAGVGWWDKEDKLTVASQKEHVVIIPKGAVMISIPGNCQGQPVPDDWTKGTRADGEWVIMRK